MTLETLILICPFCSLVRRLVTSATLIVKDIFLRCQLPKNILSTHQKYLELTLAAS